VGVAATVTRLIKTVTVGKTTGLILVAAIFRQIGCCSFCNDVQNGKKNKIDRIYIIIF
jgi:hypothetical protein